MRIAGCYVNVQKEMPLVQQQAAIGLQLELEEMAAAELQPRGWRKRRWTPADATVEATDTATDAAPIGDVVNDIGSVVDDMESADIELIADFEDTNKLDMKALGGCRPLPPGVQLDEWSDLAHAGVGFELIHVMAFLIQDVDHLDRTANSISFADIGLDANLMEPTALASEPGRFVPVSLRRHLADVYFPSQRRNAIDGATGVWMSYTAMPSDISRCAENSRKNIVEPYHMARRGGQHSELQLRMLQTKSPAEVRAVLKARQNQVLRCLADSYMKARCGVLRRWIWFCIECFQVSPWRTEWGTPGVDIRFEDELMLGFVTEASFRYIRVQSCKAARLHVEQWHLANGWPAPVFPRTMQFQRLLGKQLGMENPGGRTQQVGYTAAQMAQRCDEVRSSRDELLAFGRAKLAGAEHYKLLAMTASFETASRVGTFCPGAEFDQHLHWTLESIKSLVVYDGRLFGAKAIQLPRPKSKTSFSSSVAAQEANLRPVIFRLDNDRSFSFVRACRETPQFIDIDWANAGQAPAFQTLYGEALATSHVQSALVALEETAPLLPKGTTVSTRNLRKGRAQSMQIAAMRGAGHSRSSAPQAATAEAEATMNRVTTHTATAGRAPYMDQSIAEEIELGEQADTEEYETGSYAHRFQYRGGVPELVTVRDIGGILTTCVEPNCAPISEATVDSLEHSLRSMSSLSDNTVPAAKRARHDSTDMAAAAAAMPTQNRLPVTAAVTAAGSTQPGPVAIEAAAHHPTAQRARRVNGNLCVICHVKWKNYGLAGGTRQWCGPCAKPRGGVLKPAAGKNAEAPAPAKPDGADIRGFFGKAAGGKAYGCPPIDAKDRD